MQPRSGGSPGSLPAPPPCPSSTLSSQLNSQTCPRLTTPPTALGQRPPALAYTVDSRSQSSPRTLQPRVEGFSENAPQAASSWPVALTGELGPIQHYHTQWARTGNPHSPCLFTDLVWLPPPAPMGHGSHFLRGLPQPAVQLHLCPYLLCGTCQQQTGTYVLLCLFVTLCLHH